MIDLHTAAFDNYVMRKSFFRLATLTFFALVVAFAFFANSHKVLACQCSVRGNCGAAGQCSDGELCTEHSVGNCVCDANPVACPPGASGATPTPSTGGSGSSCVGNGCGGGCGAGYGCSNDVCVADPTCVQGPMDVPYTGSQITSLSGLIGTIWNILFPAAILFGVIMIIKAGYELMTSEGNPKKVSEAQEDLTSAILGTFFVLLSAAILRFIIVSILGGSVGF